MGKDYEKLFAVLEAPEPPANLAERIVRRIAERERRILGIKIAASAAVFGVSLIAIVDGLSGMASGLASSGFMQIGGLMFSDFSSVLANFPDFALSMVESFPVFTAALVLGGVMFGIWSMAALIDEASLMRRNHEQSFGI